MNDDATGNMNRSYAPAKFLGDWSSATSDDTLKADIFLHIISGPYVTGNYVFRLTGPGGQATGIINPTPPNDAWITYALPMEESAWQINSGTWAGLLQQVSTLIVTMEYITGDEYNRLDNVSLSFSPVVLPVLPVICSDFEAGGFDGWTFTGAGGVTNQASGGNPGRYIQVANGSGTAFAFAPPKYHGDWTQLDNHAADIRFDLKITNASGTPVLNDAFVRIAGPGGEARIPMDNSVLGAFNKWRNFSFPVDMSAWTMVSGSWGALLDFVDELAVCLEFTSSSETVGFDNFCITDSPPQAGFFSDLTFTFAGNPVQFYDMSSGGPSAWIWNFGDGNTANEQDPVHTYNQPGIYTVELYVSNNFGNDTEVKQDYIEVAGVDECVKFYDDFNDNSIHPAWQLINGTWSETNGELRQTSNYYVSGNLLGGCYAITGSQLWGDYNLTCDIKSSDNDWIGMVINYQDDLNMYMFLWNQQTPQRRLYKWENGVSTELAGDNQGYTLNQWYRMEMGSCQGNVYLNINGLEIFNVPDNTYTGGKAGLYCYGNQTSFYDNVLVECNGAEFDLKVILEGAYNGSGMSTTLNALPDFPHTQPYGTPPWNYPGMETIPMIPSNNIVDWLLLDLRDAPDPGQATQATTVKRSAVFLKDDGSIVDLDGSSLPRIGFDVNNNLYAVIWHRNHLGIMSANPLTEVGGVYMYDFSSSSSQVYGGALGAKEVSPGVWALAAGDGNADNLVGTPDKNDVWAVQAGTSGYLMGDFNLDGQVSNTDKIEIWSVNGGRGSQVP
ncbi:MAG: PKD domain-containing protein [Bacteroidales bacterium]|nr:PKD domain-containing protein [Bacteroidales bacterium]